MVYFFSKQILVFVKLNPKSKKTIFVLFLRTHFYKNGLKNAFSKGTICWVEQQIPVPLTPLLVSYGVVI